MIHEALFEGLTQEAAVTILNCVEPQFVDGFVRDALVRAYGALAANDEKAMISAASRLAGQIDTRYIKPNFGKAKSLPIMACTVSEEEPHGNQYVFMIPCSGSEYLSIKMRQDKSVLIRWPSPVSREFGHLMARLVYGNDLKGRVQILILAKGPGGVLVDQRFLISYRAGLIIGTLGSTLAGPFLDMASDDLLEDFECTSSILPRALGLKPKQKGIYLEL